MMDRSEIINLLHKNSPFDKLENNQLIDMIEVSTVKSYPEGALLFRQFKTTVTTAFIVLEGVLESFFIKEDETKELTEQVLPGTTYGYISLLFNHEKSIRSAQTVTKTKLLIVPGDFFLELCRSNQDFAAYYNSRFGRYMLTPEFRRYMTLAKNNQADFNAIDRIFEKKISTVPTRKIISCSPETTISEAADIMSLRRSGIILVEREPEEYIGYITDYTLREKVIRKGVPVTEKVSKIIEAPFVEISETAEIAQGITKMFKEKVYFLIVRKQNGERGILSRNKLLTSQSDDPILFVQSVRSARSIEELKEKWLLIPKMTSQLIERGVRSEIITKLITEISHTVTRNVVYKGVRHLGPAPTSFSFISCGSEGRREKVLSSDQDNGLIYADVEEDKKEETADYFLKLGEWVCDQLDQIGFPHCTGGYMAKNPNWNQPISVWKSYYKEWFTKPTPQSAMNASVFLDARNIYGNADLVAEISDFIIDSRPIITEYFYVSIAKNALDFNIPLSIFRSFKTEKVNNEQVINIKKAMMPIVEYTRIQAIKHGISCRNTGDRLLALHEKKVLNKKEYYELLQSYYFMMGLKIKSQSKMINKDNALPNNYIVPKRLTIIEQTTLKEIFKLMQGYQATMKLLFTKSV